MDDISKALSFEIKKEIADRYFGFRKLIEEDMRDYSDQVLSSSHRLEQRIGFDLVRLYILLRDEGIIKEFLRLTGLDEMIFYDPYLAESPTIRRRVFADRKVRGLTRKGRFKNMVLDTYESLAHHVVEYRETLTALAEERETIAEEIRIFYRNNDLGTIMGFLRNMDGSAHASGKMEGGLNPMADAEMERKMRVQAPPPVDEVLPMMPQVPPIDAVRARLQQLVEQAYALHELDVASF